MYMYGLTTLEITRDFKKFTNYFVKKIYIKVKSRKTSKNSYKTHRFVDQNKTVQN